MSTLHIKVKHKNTEIVYEQSITECQTFSATCEEGYSRKSMQSQLLSTIKQMCVEVKQLNEN